MNRASVVFGIPIQKEENRCVHSEQELQKMVFIVEFYDHVGREYIHPCM